VKKNLILGISLLAATASWAQQAPRVTAATEPELPYRTADTKVNALVHTRLAVDAA
jgi:hypothetical protein